MCISNDEVVFRRIPPGTPWTKDPDIVTSANFKTNPRVEKGLSVYRESIVSAHEVLGKPSAKPGSFILFATVGDIRNLADAEGRLYGLNVVDAQVLDNTGQPVDDPGHAEIQRLDGESKMTGSMAEALKRLFCRTYESRIFIQDS